MLLTVFLIVSCTLVLYSLYYCKLWQWLNYKLSRDRTGAKGRLTSTTNTLKTLLSQGDCCKLANLAGNIEVFHERVHSYTEVQGMVELKLSDEEFADSLKVSEDYLEECRQILCKSQVFY